MEQNELGTKRIPPLVMKLAFPLIIAQLVNGLYNIVDRIYLGHLEGAGAEILTGVGITYPVILPITAFSNLIGSGGGPLAAIRLGQKEDQKASEILTVSAASLLALSAMLMVFFYALKTPLIYLFGASDRTAVHADAYLSIYLLGDNVVHQKPQNEMRIPILLPSGKKANLPRADMTYQIHRMPKNVFV